MLFDVTSRLSFLFLLSFALLLTALVLMIFGSLWYVRYYGCGLVVPECLEGCRILDLGSGTGRDCFMLSQLVGEKGHLTGIDMTEDQVVQLSFFLSSGKM